MALSSTEKYRIGRGMNLGSVFSKISGRVEYNEGTDRINQSLKIIMDTNNGEVAMLPILGSGISEMLFEPADEILKDKMELFVRTAVENLEPRIVMQDVVIDVVENYVYITVNYILSGTNMSGKFDYTITRQAGGEMT